MFEAPNTSSHCEDRCVNAPGPRLELVRCSSAEGRVGCGSLTLAFKPAAPAWELPGSGFSASERGIRHRVQALTCGRPGEVSRSRLALVEKSSVLSGSGRLYRVAYVR